MAFFAESAQVSRSASAAPSGFDFRPDTTRSAWALRSSGAGVEARGVMEGVEGGVVHSASPVPIWAANSRTSSAFFKLACGAGDDRIGSERRSDPPIETVG